MTDKIVDLPQRALNNTLRFRPRSVLGEHRLGQTGHEERL